MCCVVASHSGLPPTLLSPPRGWPPPRASLPLGSMWVQQRQGAVCEWRRGVEGIQGARSPAPSGGSRSCGDASAATPCPWSCPLLLPNQATLGGDGSPLLPFPGRHCPSLVLNSARHSGHCPFLQLPLLNPLVMLGSRQRSDWHRTASRRARRCDSGL